MLDEGSGAFLAERLEAEGERLPRDKDRRCDARREQAPLHR